MAKEYKAVCGKILGRDANNWGDFCCLCFNPVDEDAISVNDLVTLEFKLNDMLTEELLARILISVLGDTVAENMSMFQSVCKKCSCQAIISYKFIKKCKENTENLIQAVLNLSDSFQYVNDDANYETLYVSVDPTTKAIQQICDMKKQSNPEETALARFSFIAHGARSPKSHAVHTYANTYSEEDKRRRKRDVSTIFIKTHELVADPTHPKEYKCKVCLKLYPTSGSLRQHFFAQHFKKEFECPECFKSFGTAGILQSHIQISHEVVQCSDCGKKLLNRASTLKRHAMTHGRNGKICFRCGRKYKKVTDFERHIAQETCEVPSRTPGNYTCDHCNHVYTYKSQLMTHIRFEHQGEEGFVCTWCSRKCYTASALRTHILRHTKEKNHICQQCGGKFVTKQSLTNHMRLHTGERPYKCETCGMGFLSASRRKEHIERFHIEASFECDLCPAKYSARRSLVKHKKRHFE